MTKKKLRSAILDVSTKTSQITIDDITTPYLLQSSAWAKVKCAFGWSAFAFRQEYYPDLERDVLILVKRVALKNYLAYIPDGLLSISEEEQDAEALQKKLSDAYILIATLMDCLYRDNKVNVFAVRWDMPWICKVDSEQGTASDIFLEEHKRLLSLHLKVGKEIPHLHIHRREPTQPPATLMLDLSKDEDELLSAMKSKTRYNTRLAAKKGVLIRDDLSIDDFYKLYEYTSRRNHIAIHSKEYYQKVYEELSSDANSDIKIYGAEFEGEIIAAIVVVAHQRDGAKQDAIYLYGASSDEHRSLMPAYALQWKAMQVAKSDGYKRYDMFGLPLFEDTEHRMYGIYKFKIGFGGELYFRIGAYEVANYISSATFMQGSIRKLSHRLFLLVEKLRFWYYYKYKK